MVKSTKTRYGRYQHYCLNCNKKISRQSLRCISCGKKFGKKIEWTKKLRDNLRQFKLGKNNPNWKGNSVGYNAIHEWIKNNKGKPNLCEECQLVKPYDLANISGEYKRDIKDYKWLCRKCHMNSDGRIFNLKQWKEK